MATFTYIPDRNFGVTIKPRIDIAQFGDGYSQRSTNDINSTTRGWSIAFRNREVSEINNIINFFETSGGFGAIAFTWTPPGSATSFNVICKEWAETYITDTVGSLTATFEQDYEKY